jgi:hypothetical protein
MVRPRASDRNLSIATRFAKMLISFKDRQDPGETPVPLTGSGSIHQILAMVLPVVARDNRDSCPQNRSGVTAVELNKALKGIGMNPIRR